MLYQLVMEKLLNRWYLYRLSILERGTIFTTVIAASKVSFSRPLS